MSTVNLYDTSLQESTEILKLKIEHDLSDIGGIIDIKGNITPVGDNFLMDQVVAVVQSPTLKQSTHIKVTWDAEAKEPRYQGRPSVANQYGTANPSTTEVVAGVFNRIRYSLTGPLKTWDDFNAVITKTQKWAKVRTALVTVTTLALFMLLLWDDQMHPVENVVGMLALTLCVGCVFTMLDYGYMTDRKRGKRDTWLSNWKKEQKDGFYALFDTMPEQSAFITHLTDECENAGVDFHGDVMIYRDSITNQHLLSRPVVEFKGRYGGFKYPETLLFDGNKIYTIERRLVGHYDEREYIEPLV